MGGVLGESVLFHCLYYPHIQGNLSIVDTPGTQLAVLYTGEPLYSGHPWDTVGCPAWRDVSDFQRYIGAQLSVVGTTADRALERWPVPIKRFHSTPKSTTSHPHTV